MPSWLIERTGERAGTVHALSEGVTTIGRGAHSDLTLPSHHVSRRHAEIRLLAEGYVIRDLGSKNGTFVNGSSVLEPRLLSHGDTITVPGPPDLTLTFESDEETVTSRGARAASQSLAIDPRTAEVRVRGRVVSLTAKEYLALALLYEKGGALVSKEELATRVWPELSGMVSDDSIEQIVYRLRRKLEENPVRPAHLLTVRGLGYRLVAS